MHSDITVNRLILRNAREFAAAFRPLVLNKQPCDVCSQDTAVLIVGTRDVQSIIGSINVVVMSQSPRHLSPCPDQSESLCTLHAPFYRYANPDVEWGFIDRKALRWETLELQYDEMVSWWKRPQPCVLAVRQSLAWNTRRKQETNMRRAHTPTPLMLRAPLVLSNV